jgi:protein phosphatase
MHGFGKSDIGKVRVGNEDAFYVNNEGPPPLANLFMVADGMGGHNAGEIASKQAISAFCEYFNENQSFVYTEQFLADALLYANVRVHDHARSNPALAGMGTTLSAVTTDENNLYYAHVGDSRIYVVAAEGMKQITRDHSLVAEMAARGIITPEEAVNHPEKNVITRAVGTDVHVNIDKGYFPIGDVKHVLICSDGLIDMVSDAEILEILARDRSMPDKVNDLIAKANEGGGVDNISVIMMGWTNI